MSRIGSILWCDVQHVYGNTYEVNFNVPVDNPDSHINAIEISVESDHDISTSHYLLFGDNIWKWDIGRHENWQYRIQCETGAYNYVEASSRDKTMVRELMEHIDG